MIATAGLLAALTLPLSVGTGIQTGPVTLPGALQPGHAYTLPAVTVANTGSDRVNLTLQVELPVPDNLPGRPVPAKWVTFSYPPLLWVFHQSSVGVGPGDSTKVPAQVAIPKSAKPGRYTAWVVAGADGNGSPGHLNFAAEAITILKFTVGHPAPRSLPVGLVAVLAVLALMAVGATLLVRHRRGTS